MPPSVYMPGDDSTFEGDGTTFELPYLELPLTNLNGFFSNSSLAVLMTGAVVADPRRTVNFQNLETLISTFTFIRAQMSYEHNESAWENSQPTATECSQFLCLKAINSSVALGNLTENTLSISSKKIPASWQPTSEQAFGVRLNDTNVVGTRDWNPLFHSQYVSRDDFQLDPSDFDDSWVFSNTWNASQTAIASTIQSFLSMFNNSINESFPVVHLTDSGQITATADNLVPFYRSDNLTETFEAIADSLTNTLRSSNDTYFQGTTNQWIIRYRIRWIFLIIPVTFLISKHSFYFWGVFFSNI